MLIYNVILGDEHSYLFEEIFTGFFLVCLFAYLLCVCVCVCVWVGGWVQAERNDFAIPNDFFRQYGNNFVLLHNVLLKTIKKRNTSKNV